MKTYVVTTGGVFGLITLAHILRVLEERHLARDPWFILLTLAAAGFSLWAVLVLRRSPRS